MAIKIKPPMINELKDYGAADVSACFNCGTCTASCPLVTNGNQFPRHLIRLAQLGQKDKLLASKELWTCYYCGECSESCPRDADPAGFMAAARKYAIAQYDISGISVLMNRYKWASLSILTIFSVLFVYIAIATQNIESGHNWIGSNYYELVHLVGVTSGIIIPIILFIGLFRMYKQLSTNALVHGEEKPDVKLPFKDKFNSLRKVLQNEVILQKSFSSEESKDEEPWYFSRRILHMAIMFGFSGLLFATAYNYMVKDLIEHDGAAIVPWYYPARLIGMLAGLVFVYGTGVTLYFRLTKRSEYYSKTTFADWVFLIFMFATGITGFPVTILAFMPVVSLPVWAPWVLVIHIIFAFELLLMIPFTKFAHMLYRPFALWWHDMQARKAEISNA